MSEICTHPSGRLAFLSDCMLLFMPETIDMLEAC